MTRILGAMAFLAVLVPLAGAPENSKAKETSNRKALVPGDPLDEKIQEQEKRVEANPNSADLRNDLGNLLAARRLPKAAREQYEGAMKLDRKHYLAPYNLGVLEETEGRISQAIAAYEKSVDRNRAFALSRFRLGRLYEKRGKDRAAIEQYAVALRIDPSMRDVRRNPLVADTRLLDQVSLENYSRDLASAAVKAEAVYVEEPRFRRPPVDRALSSEEVAEPAPAAPTPEGPAPAPVSVPAEAVSPPTFDSPTPAAPPPPSNSPTPQAPTPPIFRRPTPLPPLPPASGSPALRSALAPLTNPNT
jgi:tetratricopeptide (TPR) repeat protein